MFLKQHQYNFTCYLLVVYSVQLQIPRLEIGDYLVELRELEGDMYVRLEA